VIANPQSFCRVFGLDKVIKLGCVLSAKQRLLAFFNYKKDVTFAACMSVYLPAFNQKTRPYSNRPT